MTMGEPPEIGPELALRAWERRAETDAPFFVVADPRPCARLAQRLGLAISRRGRGARDCRRTVRSGAAGRPAQRRRRRDARAPRSRLRGGDHRIDRTRRRLRPVGRSRRGRNQPDRPNTCFNEAGFAFPAIPSSRKPAEQWGGRAQPVMMLWSRELAVAPVTIHIPLADVPRALTRQLIVSTARIVAADLRDRFGVASPRLAVAGLNPHAGEGGAIGREEIETIIPAIAQLRAEGVDATGPHPADTMFPCRGAGALRRSADDVSRPGSDPDQDAGLRQPASM